MTLHAVVIAAGLGTRLRPLTERYAKPVLPIDGKPVIALLLRELAEAGFDAATIVIGHLGEQVERLVGDGSGFGLDDSLRETGLARLALPTPYSRRHRWRRISFSVPTSSSRPATSAVSPRRSPIPAPRARSQSRTGPAPSRSATGSSSGCSEKAVSPRRSGRRAWRGRARRARPGKPPFELALAFQHAIDAGERVAGIQIGPTRDLTAPVDVLEENFPYLRNL